MILNVSNQSQVIKAPIQTTIKNPKKEGDKKLEEYNKAKPDFTSDKNINYDFIPDLDTTLALNKLQKKAKKEIFIDPKYRLEKPYIKVEYYEKIVENAVSNSLKEQINILPKFQEKIKNEREDIKKQEGNTDNKIKDLNKEILELKKTIISKLKKEKEAQNNENEQKNIEEINNMSKDIEKKDSNGYIEIDYSKYKINDIDKKKIEDKKEEIKIEKEKIKQNKADVEKRDNEFEFKPNNTADRLANLLIDSSAKKVDLIKASRRGLIKAYQHMRHSSDLEFPNFTFETANETLMKIDKYIKSLNQNIIDTKV